MIPTEMVAQTLQHMRTTMREILDGDDRMCSLVHLIVVALLRLGHLPLVLLMRAMERMMEVKRAKLRNKFPALVCYTFSDGVWGLLHCDGAVMNQVRHGFLWEERYQ